MAVKLIPVLNGLDESSEGGVKFCFEFRRHFGASSRNIAHKDNTGFAGSIDGRNHKLHGLYGWHDLDVVRFNIL